MSVTNDNNKENNPGNLKPGFYLEKINHPIPPLVGINYRMTIVTPNTYSYYLISTKFALLIATTIQKELTE